VIFEARALSFAYPAIDVPAVQDVSLAIGRGEFVAIVGPNGSGKTTLVRLLLGALAPTAGQARTLGRAARSWSARALAQRVGVVAQREEPVFPLRVRHMVTLGRYPHVGALQSLSSVDEAVVDRALAYADATHLGHRWIATLSGGEWQRVRLARALAQEPEVLVLDEATGGLDVRHEMEVFELVAGLVTDPGLTAVIVTHHVNLAARYADRVVVMDGGRAVAVGLPAQVLTQPLLEQVFAWPVTVRSWRGVPQFLPLKRGESAQHGDGS